MKRTINNFPLAATPLAAPLLALGLFAAISLVAGNEASAGKIQYQKVNLSITSEGVPVDMDEDGIDDVVFSIGGRPDSGEFCMVTPMPGGGVVASGLFAEGLGYEQPISARRTWVEKPSYLLLTQPVGDPLGDWATPGAEAFVGVRVYKEPGVWNYGWVRVKNVGGPGVFHDFVLRDWAMEWQSDTPIVTPRYGDVDMNGQVNVNDLLTVLSDWGACSARPPCYGDVNGDEMVDVTDLLAVIGNWTTP